MILHATFDGRNSPAGSERKQGRSIWPVALVSVDVSHSQLGKYVGDGVVGSLAFNDHDRRRFPDHPTWCKAPVADVSVNVETRDETRIVDLVVLGEGWQSHGNGVAAAVLRGRNRQGARRWRGGLTPPSSQVSQFGWMRSANREGRGTAAQGTSISTGPGTTPARMTD